jgi:hypothetical protein
LTSYYERWQQELKQSGKETEFTRTDPSEIAQKALAGLIQATDIPEQSTQLLTEVKATTSKVAAIIKKMPKFLQVAIQGSSDNIAPPLPIIVGLQGSTILDFCQLGKHEVIRKDEDSGWGRQLSSPLGMHKDGILHLDHRGIKPHILYEEIVHALDNRTSFCDRPSNPYAIQFKNYERIYPNGYEPYTKAWQLDYYQPFGLRNLLGCLTAAATHKAIAENGQDPDYVQRIEMVPDIFHIFSFLNFVADRYHSLKPLGFAEDATPMGVIREAYPNLSLILLGQSLAHT